jgi:hypothetical protein
MRQIVGRLPVVERLVAVLDWCKQRRNKVRGEEAVQRLYGLDRKRTGDSSNCQRDCGENQNKLLTFSWHALLSDEQTRHRFSENLEPLSQIGLNLSRTLEFANSWGGTLSQTRSRHACGVCSCMRRALSYQFSRIFADRNFAHLLQ